jgi:hypothetical protein
MILLWRIGMVVVGCDGIVLLRQIKCSFQIKIPQPQIKAHAVVTGRIVIVATTIAPLLPGSRIILHRIGPANDNGISGRWKVDAPKHVLLVALH